MDKMLTRKEVLEQLKISRPTMWRYIKKGVMPEGIRLSKRITRWKESMIREYIEKLTKSMIEDYKNGKN